MSRIVIIGSGFAGLSAAMALCYLPNTEIIILEKGPSYEDRKLHEAGLTEGIGGSGTISGESCVFLPQAQKLGSMGDGTRSRSGAYLESFDLLLPSTQ